jgi:hypothetical protein
MQRRVNRTELTDRVLCALNPAYQAMWSVEALGSGFPLDGGWFIA